MVDPILRNDFFEINHLIWSEYFLSCHVS
jgi:hypothetical protein